MRIRESTLPALLVLLLVANAFLLAVALTPADGLSPALSKPEEVDPLPVATIALPPPARGEGDESAASMQVPVLLQKVEVRGGPFFDEEVIEEGALVNVSVEVVPGKGRVLIQTTPLMGIVFQDAVNLAVVVASDRSRADLTESDIIFSIQGSEEISEIDGPSAGALMAVLLLSVLEDFPLNESVTVTGAIDEGGNICPVGGVIEKAEAAHNGGKTLLLLSDENDQVIEYREESQTLGILKIARQLPVATDAKEYIEENVGIQVKYVDTFDDLLADLRAPVISSSEAEERITSVDAT